MNKNIKYLLAVFAILLIAFIYLNKSHSSIYYKVEVSYCNSDKKDTVVTHQDFYPVIDTYKEAVPVFKVVDSDLGWFYLNKPKKVLPYVCSIRILDQWNGRN